MKILIVYATTEGQTRKICSFAFDHLTGIGHSVALAPADAVPDIDPSSFDAAILAGSVHAGKHQSTIIDYASTHSASLNAMKTLFLSVSLGAAGKDENDWADLKRIVDEFKSGTGWTPSRVEHVAGAFRFDEYDFFKYWAMRWIESQKDEDVPPGTDKEYTDWSALAAVLDEWSA